MRELNEIIKDYINCCYDSEEAQKKGDSNRCNELHFELESIRSELKEFKTEGTKALIELLEHENNYVRLKTAYTLLPIVTDKAEKTLEEVSKTRGLTAVSAKMTLREWKKGNLKFD